MSRLAADFYYLGGPTLKKLCLVLGVMVSALMIPSAANAAASSGLGGVGTSIGTTGINRVIASGTYTGQLTTSGVLVEFECNAEAIGVAASTAITSCVLSAGNGNHYAANIALPGNATATASVATVPLASVRLCWSATATFVVGGTASTSGCTAVNV